MKRQKTSARLGLIAYGLLASCAWAAADEAPASASRPVAAPPPTREAVSLQGFALQNPACRESSDGCSICARDGKDAPHCSTPGVACQLAPIARRREKAK